MTPSFRSRAAVGVAAVAVLIPAACGSDDASSGATTPDTTGATTAPATDPPATDPVMADPPATDPPATDPRPTDPPVTDPPATDPPAPSLRLDVDGVPVLGDAAVYEGWAIVDGAPVSTGRFLVDESGSLTDEDGSPIESFEVGTATPSAFVLTIEPVVDPDPAPSAIHLLAGDVVDGVATLGIDHAAAIGTDFAAAAGTVEVAVPTARGLAGAETSGIWFFREGSGSLTLPVLPAGWAYEGWAVIDGIPVSTGRFLDPDAADDNRQYSGDGDGPDTPGEDFIRNAPEGLTFPTTVGGATVVVSVEPDPDDSPAPFQLKPLLGELPPTVTPFSEHPLTNTGRTTVPTATATFTP